MSFTPGNSAVISTRDIALPAPVAAVLRVLPTLLSAVVLTVVTVVALAPTPAVHRAVMPPAGLLASPAATLDRPEVVLILVGPETTAEVLSELNVVNFGYSPDQQVVVLTITAASDERLVAETMLEMMQAEISVNLVDLRRRGFEAGGHPQDPR